MKITNQKTMAKPAEHTADYFVAPDIISKPPRTLESAQAGVKKESRGKLAAMLTAGTLFVTSAGYHLLNKGGQTEAQIVPASVSSQVDAKPVPVSFESSDTEIKPVALKEAAEETQVDILALLAAENAQLGIELENIKADTERLDQEYEETLARMAAKAAE